MENHLLEVVLCCFNNLTCAGAPPVIWIPVAPLVVAPVAAPGFAYYKPVGWWPLLKQGPTSPSVAENECASRFMGPPLGPHAGGRFEQRGHRPPGPYGAASLWRVIDSTEHIHALAADLTIYNLVKSLLTELRHESWQTFYGIPTPTITITRLFNCGAGESRRSCVSYDERQQYGVTRRVHRQDTGVYSPSARRSLAHTAGNDARTRHLDRRTALDIRRHRTLCWRGEYQARTLVLDLPSPAITYSVNKSINQRINQLTNNSANALFKAY